MDEGTAIAWVALFLGGLALCVSVYTFLAFQQHWAPPPQKVISEGRKTLQIKRDKDGFIQEITEIPL